MSMALERLCVLPFPLASPACLSQDQPLPEAVTKEFVLVSSWFFFSLQFSFKVGVKIYYTIITDWAQSVQFSRSGMSDSLQPHGLQHTRLPCSSPTPGVYSDSCPLSWWCHPTISSSVVFLPPSIFPSIRVFSIESVLHIRWPKYWSSSFNISPSNEHPGLISFRMDWLDLLAVQGTLKSLLQHHSSKASILWHSAFFIVQLSHPYMTTGKAIALTRQTLLAK